jgi:hypothetical protein
MRSLMLRWSVALLLGSAWGWVMSPPTAPAPSRPLLSMLR